MHNTTLGIPAIYQSEGLHGFTDNGTIFPSPLGLAASFNPALLTKIAGAIGDEAAGLGFAQVFAPVLDMARELRWGRVEENFGEDPFLYVSAYLPADQILTDVHMCRTGEMGHAYVTGVQAGARRNTSSPFRMAATCKHFAAFGSPQGGLNIAPVAGGERELRTTYLPAFKRACVDGSALSIMSAYSSYDGVPATANQHLLNAIVRAAEVGVEYGC
jgi:beta-glucosidase